MKHILSRLAVFAVCAGMGVPGNAGARTRTRVEIRKALPVESLDELFAKVMPTEQEEAWRTVGWRGNLMEAREMAQEQRRPVFLWIIVGNPQGCT